MRPRSLRSATGAARRALRRPGPYWIAALAVALVSGSTVWRLVARAQDGADRYGRPTLVAVAAHRLDPGTVVGPDDVRDRSFPADAVPPGAVPGSAAASGRTVGATIGAGEVVTGARLAPPGRGPLEALVGPDRRGVVVPRGPDPLPLRRGDHVDIDSVDRDRGAVTVADDAEVVDVGDREATVAVSAGDAGPVTEAVTAGVAQLVLVGR